MYFKIIKDEKVICVGEQSVLPSNAIRIEQDEYERLLKEIRDHIELINSYLDKVINNEMALDDIEDLDDRNEVRLLKESLDSEPKNPYGIDDDTYNNIIDNYAESIAEEVANNGYNS